MSGKSVVIIGSFRKHLPALGAVAIEMRKQGVEVLSPLSSRGLNPDDPFVILDTDAKDKSPRELQRDVLRKIIRCKLVYLVNPDGYIGLSAAGEIGFAAIAKKPVLLHQAATRFNPEVPSIFQKLVQHVPYVNPDRPISFEEQIALAKTNIWELDEVETVKTRTAFHEWMQTLSDTVPNLESE